LIRNAKKRGNHPQHRVLVIVAHAVYQDDGPQRLNHGLTVLIGDGVFDGAGETDSVWGFGFGDLTLGAQGCGVGDGQSVTLHQDRINLGDFVLVI
jgi:hypothetical protein